MFSDGYPWTRDLTPDELEAWKEYDRVLCSINRGNMYDRVSLMHAFPELQAAFDHANKVSRQTSNFLKLKNKLEELAENKQQCYNNE
jgi:hypothetical protein